MVCDVHIVCIANKNILYSAFHIKLEIIHYKIPFVLCSYFRNAYFTLVLKIFYSSLACIWHRSSVFSGCKQKLEPGYFYTRAETRIPCAFVKLKAFIIISQKSRSLIKVSEVLREFQKEIYQVSQAL